MSQETRQKRADEYRLVLYNDPLNKREYVARRVLLPTTCVASWEGAVVRCLMTICLLKEGDAYQVRQRRIERSIALHS